MNVGLAMSTLRLTVMSQTQGSGNEFKMIYYLYCIELSHASFKIKMSVFGKQRFKSSCMCVLFRDIILSVCNDVLFIYVLSWSPFCMCVLLRDIILSVCNDVLFIYVLSWSPSCMCVF